MVAEVASAKAKAEAEGLDEDEADLAADDEDEEDVLAEAETAPSGVCARSGRVQLMRLRKAAWRVRVLTAAAGGDEPDETLISNVLSFEGICLCDVGGGWVPRCVSTGSLDTPVPPLSGELAKDGMRADPAAKAMYPNR